MPGESKGEGVPVMPECRVASGWRRWRTPAQAPSRVRTPEDNGAAAARHPLARGWHGLLCRLFLWFGGTIGGWATSPAEASGMLLPGPSSPPSSVLASTSGWVALLGAVGVCGALFYRVKKLSARLSRIPPGQSEAFAHAMIASQEIERKRIAADLHDGLGQNLLLIRNRALLALEIPETSQQTAYELQEIIEATTRALQEVRQISRDLRPVKLDRLGLTRAMKSMVKEVANSSSVQFHADIEPVDGLFPREAEIHLYRIVQESLNNLIRHAQAKTAAVTIRREDKRVFGRVEDDGKGFQPPAGGSGIGLSGMSQRARILHGRFSCESAPGKGTAITVEIPISMDENESKGTNPHCG